MSLLDKSLLYLIGANHAVQFESAVAQIFKQPESVGKKRAEFTAHVDEIIDKLDIEILADEFSEEAKGKPAERGAAIDEQSQRAISETILAQCNYETVLEQLSEAKGIEHRFCDPDSIEKQTLGIEVDPQKEVESDRDKREGVWLCRIGDCRHMRVLFVCGDDHYESFAQKLASSGFRVQRGPHYRISKEEFGD